MKLKALTPILWVANVNASAAFYQKYLDFEVVANVPEEGEWDFALIQSGAVSIMLQSTKNEAHKAKNQEVSDAIMLYIDVENISDLYEKMKADMPILQEMRETFYGTKEFSVTDSDGYVLSFAEDQ